jgi:hypothetical protein
MIEKIIQEFYASYSPVCDSKWGRSQSTDTYIGNSKQFAKPSVNEVTFRQTYLKRLFRRISETQHLKSETKRLEHFGGRPAPRFQ